MIEAEKRRRPPLYLRPLTPPEELAYCLIQRSHMLLENGRLDAAYIAVQHAVRLAPHNENHAACGIEIHHRKLARVLLPWSLTPARYCTMIRQRLTGAPVPMPWEIVKQDPYHPGRSVYEPKLPQPPSPLADPLRLTELALAAGVQPHLPPECSLGLPEWVSNHATA